MKIRKICMRMMAILLLIATLLGCAPTAFAAEETITIASEPTETAQTEAPKPNGKATNSASYIDIPVEVLDFRADGFMFESTNTFGAPYSLSSGSAVMKFPDGTEVARPGEYEWGENDTTENYAFYIKGLIEDDLYYDEARDEKRVVYKPETIEYIAAALSGSRSRPNETYYDAHWNNTFQQMIPLITSTDRLAVGSWDETLGKIEGGVNGGTLLFSQVETCFDLAYYMLSNIWGKVPSNDFLGQEETNTGVKDIPYNLVVPELTKIRLKSDGKGNYTFKSAYSSTYDATEGCIYNGTTASSGYPRLNIVANLGFEHPDWFGANSTGYKEESLDDGNTYVEDNNYYYTLHARSAFVYYEEADLQFEFVGDDDVYFFVNDHLICDIGGIHGSPRRTVHLNDWAEELNLTEGDICSFDMFFGDRHLTAINLHFTTNIVMMDESVITTKEQYDPTTGADIKDGTAVLAGSSIGYGFSLLNRREFGVTNLSFKDTSLGVTLNSSTVALNSKATTAGLKLVYQTYDPTSGALHETPSSTTTYSSFYSTLSTAVNDPKTTINPLATGVYTLTGLTDTQLKNLFSVGLPAHTKLSISGLTNTVVLDGYTNTVETSCIPLDINGDSGIVINGSASRSIYGMVFEDISVVEPTRIVVDYSKAVEFDPTDLLKDINYDSSTYTLRYVGLKISGKNGDVYATKPKNLACTEDGASVASANGIYTRHGDKIAFQMTKLLETIDSCFVTYSVSANDEIVYYLVLQVQIVPANEMYYETDFADGVFNTEASDSHLFFDFTNTEADQARYDSRLYDHTNYDVGNWSVNTTRDYYPTFDNEAGTMTLQTKNLDGTEYDGSADHYVQLGKYFKNGNFLNYNPKNTEIIMIRFKIENMVHRPELVAAGKAARLVINFYSDNLVNQRVDSTSLPEAYLTNEEYLTLVLDTPSSAFLNAGHINTFRITLSGAETKDDGTLGRIVFDYIYFGPKSEAPERNSLFFDFTNDAEAQARYATATYGNNYNFDTAAYWMHNVTMDNTEGTMTAAVYYNASAASSNGPYIGMTNTEGSFPWSASAQYAPLNYIPENLQYLQIRIKTENLTTVSGTQANVHLRSHGKNDGVTGHTGTQTFSFTLPGDTFKTYTFMLNGNAMVCKEILNSFDLKFGNINTTGSGVTGKIIFDYIFLGAKEDLPHKDSVWFDFTNTQADQSRYDTEDYAKLNYDIGSWCRANDRMGACTFDAESGTMSSTLSCNAESVSYYWQTSPQLQQNFPMSYEPANAEVVQLRFKMENVERTSTTNAPYVQLNYFQTLNDANGKFATATDKALVGVTDTFSIADDYLTNGEYLTVTLPVRDAFKAVQQVTAFRIHFGYLRAPSGQTGKMTLDYLFVGTKADLAAFHASRSDFATETIGTAQNEVQELSYGTEAIHWRDDKPTEDYLLFSFDNNAASLARYDKAIYGGNADGASGDTNFDTSSGWGYNTSRNANPNFSNDSMSYEMLSTAADDYYWFDCAKKLNYQPKANDYLYFRIKFNSAVSTATSGDCYFSIYFYDTSGATISGTNHSKAINVATASEGYRSLYIPLSNSAYINTEAIGGFRLGLQYVEPATDETGAYTTGSFELDYVFIGTKEDFEKVNPQNLYIGFENSATAQARYRENLAFDAINRDVSGQWAANSTYSTQPVFDTHEGTLSFSDTSSVYNSEGKLVRTGTYVQLSTGITSGFNLKYDPSEAEIIQIRFKLENYAKTSNPSIYAMYFLHSGKKVYTGTTNEAFAHCGSAAAFDLDQAKEGYVVATIKVNANFKKALLTNGTETFDKENITALRIGFNNIKSPSTAQLGKVIIDYVYVGTEANAPVQTTYGYDTSYNDDVRHSNGSTLSIAGMGVPNLKQDATTKAISINYDAATAYTESNFTFKGTGFDIISQTGKEQGALRAVILKEDGTYFKTVSVLNKHDVDRNLYQVPVLSVHGLDYGTWQVKIFVNAAYDYGNDGNNDDYNGGLDRGNEFRFDAVRIYDPLGTAHETATPAYDTHFESRPIFTEIRNMLIDSTMYNADGDMEGALYIEKGQTEADIATYQSLGPNNETYLATNQAIAFKLVVEGAIPKSLDIGAKSADGKPVNLTVTVTNAKPATKPTKQDRTLTSCTAQYYPIDVSASLWTTSGTTKYVFVTVYNAGGSGILSLTDIKRTYDSSDKTSKSMRFTVDDELVNAITNAPVLDEDLDFTMSISAGAEMTVSYNIVANAVNTYKDFYLEVTKEVAGGESITTVYGMTEDREAMTVKTDPTTGEALMYQVTYTGINAKEMGDNFSTTLYAVGEDGTIYYGTTVVDSIKSFLVEKLDAEASIPELKTMAVDMLKYGAAAQVRLGYNTENLVTADLTEEQLSYATTEIPDAVNNAASSGTGAAVNTNITVTSRVQLNLSCIYTTATDPNAVKCIVTDSEGNVLAEIPATNKNNLMFTAIYENVGAKEMRDVINATFYEGETAISQTVSWSVESYVAQVRAKTTAAENEIAMVNAMLTYGDAVAAYMEAK